MQEADMAQPAEGGVPEKGDMVPWGSLEDGW